MLFSINFQLIATLGVLLGMFSSSAQSLWPNLNAEKCAGVASKLKYLSGDALIDSPNCIGPNHLPYPSSTINRAFNGGSSRKGRQSQYPTTVDPIVMQSTLLSAYREVNDEQPSTRHGELIEFSPRKEKKRKRDFRRQAAEGFNVNHHMEFCVPLEIARRKITFNPSSALPGVSFFVFCSALPSSSNVEEAIIRQTTVIVRIDMCCCVVLLKKSVLFSSSSFQ